MSIFRTLVKSLLLFSDKDSIDILSTHLLTNIMPEKFLTLLEVMVAKKVDTKEMENTFASLISIRHFDLKTINQFLEILNKDPSYLANNLLNDSNYGVLKNYISQLGKDSPETLERYITPSILANFKGSDIQYFELVEEVVKVMPSLIKTLLHDNVRLGVCESPFQNYLIKTRISDLLVVKNFISYLAYDLVKFNYFEDSFLSFADAECIVEYALQVSASNKRKILKRLVELKKENFLVKFIENFPEYDSLLLML